MRSTKLSARACDNLLDAARLCICVAEECKVAADCGIARDRRIAAVIAGKRRDKLGVDLGSIDLTVEAVSSGNGRMQLAEYRKL